MRIAGTPQQVNNTIRKGNPAASPIITASAGTAGASRNWRFLKRMTDAGRLTRVRTAIICDYNDSTVNRLKSRVRQTLSPFAKQTHSSTIIMPQIVHTTDGFLLNPYAFHAKLGEVNEDLDQQVENARRQSLHYGSQPQVILEFLGFGGHAYVGLMLHRKLRAVFPEAKCLPIISIPDDETLQAWMQDEVQEPQENAQIPQWMRHGTYNAYQEKLSLMPYEGPIVIRNRNDQYPNDRLALALAAIESAGADQMKGGSLPEAVAGIRLPKSGGSIGLNMIQRTTPSRMAFTLGFPLLRRRPLWGKGSELPNEAKNAVYQCLKEGSLLYCDKPEQSADTLADFYSDSSTNPNPSPQQTPPALANRGTARVYLTIPASPAVTAAVEQNVKKQLLAEGFYENHGEIDIKFGPASFPELNQMPEEDADYFRTPSAKLAKTLGAMMLFPFRAAVNLMSWPFIGHERKPRELSIVATALYPLEGQPPIVTEILSRPAAAKVPTSPEYNLEAPLNLKEHTEPATAPPRELQAEQQPARVSAAAAAAAKLLEAEPERMPEETRSHQVTANPYASNGRNPRA